MGSIPAPVSLPSPVTWWQDPKTRARLIAAAVLAAMYVAGLAYGSWTRVCAGEHCPSISRLVGSGDNVQMQTSKVFAADGRLISELGLERRTVLPLSEIPIAVRQAIGISRSEEHTSKLQSRLHLVCRLLLEKKKNRK